MWWLIGVIVIITAFAIPRFGCALLVLLALSSVIGTGWYFVNKYQDNQSKKRISPSEIQLSDLYLAPRYSEGSYELEGRIKNGSSTYTMTDLRIKITMQDCMKSKSCEIIGESTAWVFNDIPPGQSRNLKDSVHFSNLPKPRGKYEWYYSITEIKGK
jgi:hypothetical protein